MTTSPATTLEALIERLEKATGPDRELDLEIARLRDEVVLRRNEAGAYEDFTHWYYTLSVDDALALVSDDHTVYLTRPNQRLPYATGRLSVACVAPQGLGGPQFAKKRAHLMGYGATPALALCIACLKARAHGSGHPNSQATNQYASEPSKITGIATDQKRRGQDSRRMGREA